MQELKVAIVKYYPMANELCKVPTWRPNSRCTMPGMGIEIVKLIADYLNWTIVPTVIDLNEYDEEHTDFMNGKYDMYAMTFEKTKIREEFFDFSDELYKSHSRLIVRRADNSFTSLFEFLGVYDLNAWLMMGLSLLIFMLIGGITRYVEYRLALRGKAKFSEIVWRMIRLQLVQYQRIDYKLFAGSFSLLVFALCQATIIIALYQTWIISSMVRYHNPNPFHIEELPRLLKERKYKFVSHDMHEWYMEEIRRNVDSEFYEYRRNMHNDSFLVVNNSTELLDYVNQGRGVAVEQDDLHLSFEVRNWCDLIHLPSPFPERNKYFMLRKNNTIRDGINKGIRAYRMLIHKIHRQYVNYRQPSMCPEYSDKPRAFALVSYYGVFILLVTGLGLALFVFGGEIVTKWCCM